MSNSSSSKQPFFIIGDIVFAYANPIAFIGALFYGVLSLMNIDPSIIIVNKTSSVFLNILISLCGIISMFAFFDRNGNIPIIGPTLLPNGNSTVKHNIVA